jgi:hypothetical protein
MWEIRDQSPGELDSIKKALYMVLLSAVDGEYLLGSKKL